MAAYREHITVSGTLGIAYAFSAVFALGFSITQATIAAILTWIAGMLPDMDSQSGKPVRELFGVTAALAPLLLLQHTNELGISDDRAMLFSLLLYGGVRYGGAAVLGKLTVHRGMFHSIPAAGHCHRSNVSCRITVPRLRVRLLMAMGVALGFMSHLVLDEMYSVQWDGVRIKLSKSAGSAVKFFGRDALPNGLALGLMMFLTYVEPDVCRHFERIRTRNPLRRCLQVSDSLEDAPAFQMADEPTDSVYR